MPVPTSSFHFFSPELGQRLSDAHQQLFGACSHGVEEHTRLAEQDLLQIRQQLDATLDNDAGIALREETHRYIDALRTAALPKEWKTLTKPAALLVEKLKGSRVSPRQRRIRVCIKGLMALTFGLDDEGQQAFNARLKSLPWLDSTAVDFGLRRQARCTNCNSTAELHVASNTHWLLTCSACGHRHCNSAELDCPCAGCGALRLEFARSLRQALLDQQPDTLRRHQQWADTLKRLETPFPSNLQMQRDHEFNKNGLGKNLRAILQVRPTSLADLEDCIERYCNSSHERPLHVYQEAVDKCLIYVRTHKVAAPADSLHELMLQMQNFQVDFIAGNDHRCGGGWINAANEERANYATTIANLLLQADLGVLAAALRFSRSNIALRFTCSRYHASQLHLWYSDRRYCEDTLLELAIPPRRAEESCANPFFLDNPAPPALPAPTRRAGTLKAKNLFNSGAEVDACQRLERLYPQCRVIPNRLLRQLIGFDVMEALKADFTAPEQRYLQACELDFCVFDAHGELLHVEEVQRGDHHNEPEWVEKDLLKRKALALIGVQLQESF
jgi:hypothetical protein